MASVNFGTERQFQRTTFEWPITKFPLLLEDLEGETTSICSPFFYSKDKKEKWWLEFFPRGDEDSAENYSSLYLNLSSEKLPLMVKLELCIIQLGSVVGKRRLIHEYDTLDGLGFPNFVEKSDLLDNTTDTFTITCRIDKPMASILRSLSDPPMAMTEELSVDEKTGRWMEDFAEILENSKFSDVTIIVENEKFQVHKAILGARSAVFSAMFENKEMDENTKNEIKIEKMEPAVVKGMLEFIYTDNVSNLDEISNGLLSAADKYDLVRLRALCEKSLAKTLSNETAVEILVLADLHRSDNLKKHVMQFMENHLADIIESEGYTEIEEKYPRLLMEFIRFMALQKKSQKS